MAESATSSLVRCTAGGCSFFLEARSVESVHADGAFKPNAVARGPLGYVRHQGVEKPVYQLPELLGLADGPLQKLASIVVMRGNPGWALAVESAAGEFATPTDRFFSLPRPLRESVGGKVAGVAALDDGIAYLLDVGRLAPAPSDDPPEIPVRPIETAFDFPVRAQGRPQIFRFQLPGEPDGPTILVSAGQTAAALNPTPLSPRPGGDRRVMGMLAFQGIPTPVLDLGRRLGREPSNYGDVRKLLLVRGRRSGQLCALPVGTGLRLAQADGTSRAVETPPEAAGLLGCFEAGGETLWALDVDAALA